MWAFAFDLVTFALVCYTNSVRHRASHMWDGHVQYTKGLCFMAYHNDVVRLSMQCITVEQKVQRGQRCPPSLALADWFMLTESFDGVRLTEGIAQG